MPVYVSVSLSISGFVSVCLSRHFCACVTFGVSKSVYQSFLSVPKSVSTSPCVVFIYQCLFASLCIRLSLNLRMFLFKSYRSFFFKSLVQSINLSLNHSFIHQSFNVSVNCLQISLLDFMPVSLLVCSSACPLGSLSLSICRHQSTFYSHLSLGRQHAPDQIKYINKFKNIVKILHTYV